MSTIRHEEMKKIYLVCFPFHFSVFFVLVVPVPRLSRMIYISLEIPQIKQKSVDRIMTMTEQRNKRGGDICNVLTLVIRSADPLAF